MRAALGFDQRPCTDVQDSVPRPTGKLSAYSAATKWELPYLRQSFARRLKNHTLPSLLVDEAGECILYVISKLSTLDRTRTCNLLVRNQTLYPLSHEGAKPQASFVRRGGRDSNPGWSY